MKPNLKVALSSFALLATCSAGVILFNRQFSSSTASGSIYKSATADATQKYKQFTDKKCLAFERLQDIQRADILRDTNHINPKGVQYRTVFVAVTVKNEEGASYVFQIIDYRKGQCSAPYSTVGDEEESNPFSRFFSVPENALKAQTIWDKWRLENIPNWRQTKQRYLNGTKVQLAKEEYLSLKQLGFRMPKKWEEIK